MKSTLVSLAFVTGSLALVPREEPCCFQITASGGPGGIVRQLGDGQNRIGDRRLPLGEYCIQGGALTDAKGRGCILTPPTTQWQCDEGAKGTPGFSIGTNGSLTYEGSTTFYSCPTEDHEGWNLYSKPLPAEPKCVSVVLMADKCYAAPTTSSAPPNTSTQSSSTALPKTSAQSSASVPPKTSSSVSSSSMSSSSALPTTTSAPSSSAPPKTTVSSSPSSSAPAKTTPASSSSTSASSAPPQCPGSWTSTPPGSSAPPACTGSISQSVRTSSSSSKASSTTPSTYTPPAKHECPMDLPTNFEFPHLIIPIDKTDRDHALGNTLNGTASRTISTIYNFDLPADLAGKTCVLHFLFPEQSQLETSSYTYVSVNKNEYTFSLLQAPASKDTTYNNQPAKHQILGTFDMMPGNAYHIAEHACSAGTTTAFLMEANAGFFDYFQDFNPCPIGLYITSW